MGKLILLTILLICNNVAHTQRVDSLNAFLSIPGNFSDLSVDNAGNMYVLIDNRLVKKLNERGDSIAVYNDVKRYGKITSVDVTNPLKILVYYQESSVIAILDRFLSLKQVIDLRKIQVQQASLVRLAYDNNIWVYDAQASRIKKIDDNGRVLFESTDLRSVFEPLPSFHKLVDDNRSLYLYDSLQGWYVFDYYGAFIRRYAFLNWRNPQVLNGNMMGSTDTSYVSAKQGDFDFKEYPLHGVNAVKMVFGRKHMYILYADKLEVFDAP